jgi:hypothetical protein
MRWFRSQFFLLHVLCNFIVTIAHNERDSSCKTMVPETTAHTPWRTLTISGNEFVLIATGVVSSFSRHKFTWKLRTSREQVVNVSRTSRVSCAVQRYKTETYGTKFLLLFLASMYRFVCGYIHISVGGTRWVVKHSGRCSYLNCLTGNS